MDDASIRDALARAAAPFATAPPPDATPAPDATSPPAVKLTYAPLFRALAPDVGPEVYPLALEFVYEGYLSHYRVGRLLRPETSAATRLLAGDHFDASGLRLVARAGDLDAVLLLTRLMASCSWLRAERQPFAYDDDLWVLCVAGIASAASGGNAFAALRVFSDVGRLFERDRIERLPEVVRRGAATLWLRHASPLRAALGLGEALDAAAQAAPDAARLDAAAVEAATAVAPASAPAVAPASAPAPDAEVAL